MIVGCSCCSSRRGFLVGAAALAAGPALAAPAGRPVVDVHAHFVSPAYLAALPGRVAPPMPGWTVQAQLDAMEQGGVERALLSLTTPGVPLPGEAGRKVAREMNEFGARLVADHRPRFGLFACLPMLDIDGAMAEAEYALDVLKANGIALLTSYEGRWLGDPRFDPLFDMLNRRRAVVYVHPTAGPCCAGALPFLNDAMIEYGTDTTRAVASFVYRGAAARYPDLRIIWSHAGGTMPFLIERFDVADRNVAALKAAAPQGFRAAANRFFYDTAQASNPVAMGALRKVIAPDRILFGTDFPYRAPKEQLDQLERGGVFSPAELAAISKGNLVRDLPVLLA